MPLNPCLIFSSFLVIFVSIFLFNPYAEKWNWIESNVADLLVTNAFIYTSDPSLPFADSMAIKNARILRVGNYSSLQELQGKTTKKLNLKGKVVVPGFIDSHVHFLYGGIQMAQLQLTGVHTKEEFIKRIAEGVKGKAKGSWVLGGGWSNDLWGGEFPTATWIDEVTPHNPVCLTRLDGHMGLANSVALKMVGVTRDTEDPPGGTIMRSKDGEPTGLLVDAARKLILSHIPEASIDERREAMLRASKYALTKGVTTVVDVGRYIPGDSVELSWQDFTDVYSWASSSRKMAIRVSLFFPAETWPRLVDLVKKTGHAISEWLYLGGVKYFFDGTIGSNSALFYEAYAEDPENFGLQMMELENLTNIIAESDKNGLQVAIHAIGDKANDLVLDMYESVASMNGVRDRRFRIEHAQHLSPGAVARYGKQGIVASVQPQHLLDDSVSVPRKLGKNRAEEGAFLYNSLLASGVQLAFGSDWPITDINPLNSIRAAVTRIPPGWEIPWNPSECLTLKDALDAHTISAARACFLDKEIGSLSPGKLADFVVLSTDSWDKFNEEAYASIEATYIGGVKAYAARDVM